MGDSVTLDQVRDWLGRFRTVVHEQSTYLTELDSAIGDADHGTNLTRGMDAVMDAVEAPDAGLDTVADLLKKVGMTLVSKVGGSSGPLYGTFFLRAGTSAGAVDVLDGDAVLAMLQAGVGGVVARGKAEAGDKTMVDALLPAVAALEQADGDLGVGLRAAADAAAEGRDATEPLEARKGRASYLGERSIGHIDPGAASSALLLAALADAVA